MNEVNEMIAIAKPPASLISSISYPRRENFDVDQDALRRVCATLALDPEAVEEMAGKLECAGWPCRWAERQAVRLGIIARIGWTLPEDFLSALFERGQMLARMKKENLEVQN